MPTTTNLALPYPAAGDNPAAPVVAALPLALDALVGAWASYTTSLTENGVAVTFSVLYSKYRQIGKVLYFKQRLQCTGSGTSGVVTVGLPPVAPKYSTTDMALGFLYTTNPAGAVPVIRTLQSQSGSTTIAQSSSTIGFNLSNTRFINTWGSYEVA
jgi:hypothetical protein